MTIDVELLPLHPLLGRHVVHDSRSLAYGLPVLPKGAIASQQWQRAVPIFDQGQVGSCTGNAAAGWLATANAARPGLTSIPHPLGSDASTTVDEQLAVAIYSAATAIDSTPGTYPPDDTGSDGLSVAKVLQANGLAVAYQHAFSVDAVYAALQSGPGLLGIVWYQSMFNTAADGHIDVRPASGVAGGHEIIVPRIDVTAAGVVERIWIDNSWGPSWGAGGAGYFTPAEAAGLLAAQGDFVVPSAQVVVPTPAPPAPSPSPSPSPGDASFRAAVAARSPLLLPWLVRKANVKAQTVETYAAGALATLAHIQ